MILITIILLFLGFMFYAPNPINVPVNEPTRIYEYEEGFKEKNQKEKKEEPKIIEPEPNSGLPEELPQEYDHIKPIKPMNIYTISNYPIILVLTGTTCPHCHNYKPILEEVLAEHNLMAYEVDMWALTESEKAEMTKIVGKVDGVPTTIILNQNEVVDKRTGSLQKSLIEELLKTNGFIN